MRTWVKGILALSLIGNAGLCYVVVDRAALADDLGTSVAWHEGREETLMGLVRGLGAVASRDSVISIARRRWPKAIIKIDGQAVEIDDVTVGFDRRGIVEVK